MSTSKSSKRRVSSVPDGSVEPKKINPSIMPLGFSVAEVGGVVIVIDYLDVLDGRPTIVGSFGLPKDKAVALARTLMMACEGNDEDRS